MHRLVEIYERMTNRTQWEDMDSGEQTHKEKIKLNG